MRIFSWMQNKLNGKHGNKSSNTQASDHVKQVTREEFNDWPHGLLAIGTFGNNELKERSETLNNQEEYSIFEHVQDFTPEEVGELQKELAKLLSKKPNAKVQKESAELPLDRFLNCPSSLEVDRRITINALCSESTDKEEDIEKAISVILGRCKETSVDKSGKSIGKKSLSFLLKKLFACANGFAPAPSLRDTLQESRMEKILRTMLHKKLSPQQSTSRAPSTKKHLEERQLAEKKYQDEGRKSIDEGCRWVKTDSQYIVLEI